MKNLGILCKRERETDIDTADIYSFTLKYKNDDST